MILLVVDSTGNKPPFRWFDIEEVWFGEGRLYFRTLNDPITTERSIKFDKKTDQFHLY